MDPAVGAIIRIATADDSEAVIALLRASWSGYPGVVFDLDGELPELKEFADHYAARGGAREMTLWSGTRFIESHALYRSPGCGQSTETRQLNHLSNTTEFLFSKALGTGFTACK